MESILQGSHFSVTLELSGGLTARCFPLKENKDMFIFEFCSLMNLGMYIIIIGYFTVSSLVRFLFTRCVKQTHSLRSFVCFTQLVNKNRTRSPIVK